MKNELTYEKAYNELEAIVNEIENEKTPLEVLSEKTRRALELIHYCRNQLRSMEDLVNKNPDSSED